MSLPYRSKRPTRMRRITAKQVMAPMSEADVGASIDAEYSGWRTKTYGRMQVNLPERLVDWANYPLQKRAFEQLLEEKFRGFPWLAQAWSDYVLVEAKCKFLLLLTKKFPALKAALEVQKMGQACAEAERRAKVAEYLLSYYETIFPWLTEFRGPDVDELLVLAEAPTSQTGEESLEDPARKWLTEAEYENLPNSRRFQLALDRYWQKKKSRWEVGRDYERYWGYEYESNGFAVRYQGIIEGFEDLGRDLVCTKDSTVEIVQCKYWAKDKLIHERHVFQLFGTVTAYRIDHHDETVTGTLATSTRLSEKARRFAEALSVKVKEDAPIKAYPCVKCNVSYRDGAKIYHLPFDQQYDRTTIEKERLERYVSTVAEAEALGFRRAFRWRGDK